MGISREPTIDFGLTVDDYVKYRPAFPTELFDRLASGFGIGLPGQRALDLGTGTGAVARELARRGCEVTGLDTSPAVLAAAAKLAAAEGLNVRFIRGVAEATGVPAHAFEVVTAAICWHWFDGDRTASEVLRVLVPGGRLAIIDFNWLSHAGNIVEATTEALHRHTRTVPGRWLLQRLGKAALARLFPVWSRGLGIGIRPDRIATLAAAGYRNLESFSFDVDVLFDHEAWRGRIRSQSWMGGSQSPSVVARFDARLAAVLREKFREEPLSVPHRVFVVVGRAP